MTNSLKILLVSAECVPFAKTGGLGDVVGALPLYLHRAGHDVIIVIPFYSFIDKNKYAISTIIDKMVVPVKGGAIACRVLGTKAAGEVPVYFIDYIPYFGRPNIYHDENFNDYYDNPERFAFLSGAALKLCRELSFTPDIVHANDWHTAILPAFLKRFHADDPLFRNTASVLTIHNLAYQGRYDKAFYFKTGLEERDFTPDKFECYNAVNLLKGGIHFADKVNTVSKSYADETRTPAGGFGLDPFLRGRGEDYSGILNGVDYSEWDPSGDPLIPQNYSPASMEGKSACKSALRDKFSLSHSPGAPVIGIISRLVEQKGFYILAGCIADILGSLDVQFAILGTGDKRLESFYSGLRSNYPGKIGTFIGYSNELAHLIEAGSDFLLMPSLYEPCGLTQIYALKYGTLPVVRATGGLNDTVENYNPDTGEGTGFKFSEPSSGAITGTLRWALDTYSNHKPHFEKLIRKAMSRNFSWEKSAGQYVSLYESAIEKKKSDQPELPLS